MTGPPILVGYDGSPQAQAALDWALDEAARHAAPIRLVYVYEWTTPVVPVPFGTAWPDRTVRHRATAMVDRAVAQARRARPGLDIDSIVSDGMVTQALCGMSGHARLLVLGNRGIGGFKGLLAGSVAVGVATHANCPVVVVRGIAAPGHPVVVGVDESDDSDRVLSFAFEQAADRGVELIAVRAWQPPPAPWLTDAPPLSYDLEELAAVEHRLTVDAVQPWQDKYSQVTVTLRVLPSAPAAALVTASYDAQLVVVGCRGHGGFRGLLLGSVARHLIHHSSCPVAVVRDGAPHGTTP
jgi:nucleotide-binding universal stress UspA family protein